MQKKKPVVLMVPVNLRKFFPSLSMLNFFNWIEPGYNFTTQDQSFEAILKYTKEFFETELTKEKMSAHISELLALELHPILRLAPLELKNLCIQAGAKYSEKNTTAIFSNMSAVKMPESYVPYIERFGVYTNTPKLELCLCSFQDKLSFAFTSRYDTVNIERNFYRLLKEQGIASEKVKPEFPKTDEPSEQEMKVYKIYSFLCITIVAAMLVTDLNFHPRIRWTLFTAGGVVTMWIASSIGFFKRYNLLKNAMQALEGQADGRIILRVRRADRLQVEIEDNGPGIPEEIREQIFIPFFTTKTEGSGIGLSLCKQIIRQHDGHLSIRESRPGQTIFSLDLP